MKSLKLKTNIGLRTTALLIAGFLLMGQAGHDAVHSTGSDSKPLIINSETTIGSSSAKVETGELSRSNFIGLSENFLLPHFVKALQSMHGVKGVETYIGSKIVPENKYQDIKRQSYMLVDFDLQKSISMMFEVLETQENCAEKRAKGESCDLDPSITVKGPIAIYGVFHVGAIELIDSISDTQSVTMKMDTASYGSDANFEIVSEFKTDSPHYELTTNRFLEGMGIAIPKKASLSEHHMYVAVSRILRQLNEKVVKGAN